MRRLALAVTIAAALATPVRGDPPDPAPGPRGPARTRHMIAIAAGLVLYASSETFFKEAISPDRCRWCVANPVDRGVRDALLWDDPRRAVVLSNITGYAVAPLLPTALLVASASRAPERLARITDDLIPVLEAAIASQIVTQLFKISVARQRPYAHFTMPATPSVEDNLSFISGHSSFTMSIAVSAGMVASRRGYRLAPAIWASGLALAATTMYLRIAGDKHYFSDVVVGALAGTLTGYLVPTLLHDDVLGADVNVVPTGNGVAVIGTF